jgi:hypothetical protein
VVHGSDLLGAQFVFISSAFGSLFVVRMFWVRGPFKRWHHAADDQHDVAPSGNIHFDRSSSTTGEIV